MGCRPWGCLPFLIPGCRDQPLSCRQGLPRGLLTRSLPCPPGPEPGDFAREWSRFLSVLSRFCVLHPPYPRPATRSTQGAWRSSRGLRAQLLLGRGRGNVVCSPAWGCLSPSRQQQRPWPLPRVCVWPLGGRRQPGPCQVGVGVGRLSGVTGAGRPPSPPSRGLKMPLSSSDTGPRRDFTPAGTPRTEQTRVGFRELCGLRTPLAALGVRGADPEAP